MSVDIEDWFQVGAFEKVIDRRDWNGLSDRVDRNVRLILDLFDEACVKATFFTLGWVAARHNSLMQELVARGHEVASHGWDHERVFTMDRAQFAADIDRARKQIEDAGGVRVQGYRAPSFSIDSRTPWAFEVLAEKGYRYSSSVAPIRHDHYGWAEAPPFAFHPLEGQDLIEIPVTTAKLGSRRLGAGGGGFFRILPYHFSRWAISQNIYKFERPAVFYFHPWEIDPDQPRVAAAPLRSRLRHYTKLEHMAGKLRRLLKEFSWGRMDELAQVEKARLESEAV
ncbi:XrtA system polysaccharide deacetylase [Altericroceibacterium spongiae]|nr:XrtA system polysaccharide deacetylase [Altericroceibacterium spongiae]